MKNIIAIVLLSMGLLIITSLVLTNLASEPQPPTPKSYALKYNITEKDTEIITYKLTASADIEVPTVAKHPLMPLYSRLEQTIEQKVLKITDGQITRIDRTYRSSKYFISKSSQVGKPEPLDGKKVVIESDGTITATPALAPELKELISVNEHRFGLILPADEVQAKSEWDAPGAVVAAIFNFSNYKKRSITHGCNEVGINAKFSTGTLHCLLKEVKSDNAIIEMDVTLKGVDNGMNLAAALKGTGTFNIKKGRFAKIELSGDLALDGVQPCKNQANPNSTGIMGPCDGKGKITISYEFK